jgi:membrane protein required for colicin V production
MNLLDLGIIVLVVLITLRGYYRGLFQELAVLAGVVGGVLVAANTYLFLAAYLQPWLKDPLHARIAAFALILLAVYWLTRLLAHFLQRLLYYLYLDFFDRLLGAFFALVKAGLLLGFALMFLGLVVPRDSHLLKESRTAPYLVHLARQALDLLPPDFKQRLTDQLRQWQKPQEKERTAAEPAGITAREALVWAKTAADLREGDSGAG